MPLVRWAVVVDDDESSEDSEIFMLRRRREERRQKKLEQRIEFLENILPNQTVVLNSKENASSDEFAIDDTTSDWSCAICLIDYEEGNSVSLSHNPRCRHHFHRECIMSWLETHDECPCCRRDYLSFGEEEEEDIVENSSNTRDEAEGSGADNDATPHEDIRRNAQLDRLYGTGIYEQVEESMNYGADAGLEVEEPWEVRLGTVVEELRRQVQEQIQVARTQVREHRDNRRNRGRTDQNENVVDDERDENELDDSRVERSIQILRGQFSRLREVAAREIQNRRTRNNPDEYHLQGSGGVRRRNREERMEDAIQVVRSRLNDIAQSDRAQRIRERSTRTVQNLIRHTRNRTTGR